jgi:hypothetical protein
MAMIKLPMMLTRFIRIVPHNATDANLSKLIQFDQMSAGRGSYIAS